MISVYTVPTHNFFKAFADYVSALRYGGYVRLMRVRNEETSFPIKKRRIGKAEDYTMSYGAQYTINEAKRFQHYSEFEQDLMINWIPLFGTPEAADNYYKTGVLTEDNLKGVGYCHYVKRIDIYEFLKDTDPVYAKHYLPPTSPDVPTFLYPPERRDETYWDTIIFKHKVWAVVTDQNVKPNHMVSIFNVLAAPLKYIPKRSILKMGSYTVYTFRVGGVTNGYSIEFHIPKKFSFKN